MVSGAPKRMRTTVKSGAARRMVRRNERRAGYTGISIDVPRPLENVRCLLTMTFPLRLAFCFGVDLLRCPGFDARGVGGGGLALPEVGRQVTT